MDLTVLFFIAIVLILVELWSIDSNTKKNGNYMKSIDEMLSSVNRKLSYLDKKRNEEFEEEYWKKTKN